MSSDVVRNHQMAQGFFYRYDLYEKRILTVFYGVLETNRRLLPVIRKIIVFLRMEKELLKVDYMNDIVNKVASLGKVRYP